MPRKKYRVTWDEQDIRYVRTFRPDVSHIVDVPAKVKEQLESKPKHKDVRVLQVEELT